MNKIVLTDQPVAGEVIVNTVIQLSKLKLNVTDSEYARLVRKLVTGPFALVMKHKPRKILIVGGIPDVKTLIQICRQQDLVMQIPSHSRGPKSFRKTY